MRFLSGCAALAVLLPFTMPVLSAPGARTDEDQGRSGPKFARRWTQRLQENDQRLQRGEWGDAESEARRLLQEIVDSPRRLLEPVGAAAYQYALALAGKGQLEDARWYSEVARAFHPTIPVEQLQRNYGEPGRQVAKWFQGAATLWDPVNSTAIKCDAKEQGPEITVPRKLSGKDPDHTLRGRRFPGTAIVSLVIDEGGVPRAPNLPAPERSTIGFLWATLEALRTWRFEPGQRNGEPVTCRYTVTTTIEFS